MGFLKKPICDTILLQTRTYRAIEAVKRGSGVNARLWRHVRSHLALLLVFILYLAPAAHAAPYADYVIDARTGEVLHQENAETRLHPASLTKMMTLYVAFEAIKRGEITLDTPVTISKNAAAEPPSKLGLRPGQKIRLRYLIRAAAVRSANDAATAIGEAISGSEAAFAERMNKTAKALGMTKTTFKNANGLTRSGHLSTARDMTLLGRSLFYDHPEYYNLFSRRSTDAGVKTVNNTNRRFLDAYPGADGIKTGFTNAAGFNLVGSAQKGNKRIIATVFGGKSTQSRNARMAELLDIGFRKAPANAPIRKPAPPDYRGMLVAGAGGVAKSPRPLHRPASPPSDLLAALKDGIDTALSDAQTAVVVQAAPAADSGAPAIAAPVPRPEALVVAGPAAEGAENAPSGLQSAVDDAMDVVALAETVKAEDIPVAQAEAAVPATPRARPEAIEFASLSTRNQPQEQTLAAELAQAVAPVARPSGPEVVTRMSSSGGRIWAINLGRYPTRFAAEGALLKTALAESRSLSEGLRKVVARAGGFDAQFAGLTRDQADLACRRLQARNQTCFTVSP
jgi:D-alanyl-D-alanine carboxypeptidase